MALSTFDQGGSKATWWKKPGRPPKSQDSGGCCMFVKLLHPRKRIENRVGLTQSGIRFLRSSSFRSDSIRVFCNDPSEIGAKVARLHLMQEGLWLLR